MFNLYFDWIFDEANGWYDVFLFILFQLINVNDEEPVFSAGVYDADVAENSPAGTPVIIVTAVDRDEGNFGQVSYSLAG